jgi:CRP/FNR family transcriptional regulator
VHRLHQSVVHQRSIKRGGYLYRTGEVFGSLYVVVTGVMKATMTHDNGIVQVTGFRMSGDVAGIDAIANGVHECDLMAIEDSVLCGIRYAEFVSISRSIPALQHHFHRMMSAEITRSHELMFLLGSANAKQRLAAFLVSESKRLSAHQRSANRFRLPMSRQDISSYMGLTLETVCRALADLQRRKIISIKGRDVEITDFAGLEQLIRVETNSRADKTAGDT